MPKEKLIYRLTKLAGTLPFIGQHVLKWHMPGLPEPFYLRSATSDAQTFRQIFIYNEYEFSLVAPPRVIIDAGANIGLATLYFASLYPSARIIAIEPEPSNFALLQANVENYPNITAIQAAIWNKNEVLQLSDPGRGHWGFQIMAKENASQDSQYDVQGMTLDDIMATYELDYIDYLKIDIEGAELEVFQDKPGWVSKVGVMVLELHDRDRPGCRESFFGNIDGFDHIRELGENVIAARVGLLKQ